MESSESDVNTSDSNGKDTSSVRGGSEQHLVSQPGGGSSVMQQQQVPRF